jgi:hypothetical protein
MKRIAMLLFGLALSAPAFAWDCPTGQIRQQAASGTPTTTPYYDVVEGIAFICVPTPTTTAMPSTTTSNSTSGANATSGSTSSANASGGNATSKSGVSNSGNSNVKVSNSLANTNSLSNTQGQKQSQSQSNSSTNANQSAGGSVENVGNEQTVVQRSAPPALGPTIFPSGCNGSISGGASAPFGGISIGGTKQDHHCQAMQTAAMFLSQGNLEAATRILCRTWAARDAKLTLDQCRLIAKAQEPVPVVRTIVPIVSTPAPAPIEVEITNNIPPAPAPIILHEEMTVTAPRPQAKKRAAHRPCPVTEIQNQCAVKTQEK